MRQSFFVFRTDPDSRKHWKTVSGYGMIGKTGLPPGKDNKKMNKTELVEVVSSKAEITKVEANKVVTATLDAIVEGLVSDGKVILPGFGSFETRQRSARSGRNPRTGETIKIKATKAPAFKPGKGMKDAVAKKKK